MPQLPITLQRSGVVMVQMFERIVCFLLASLSAGQWPSASVTPGQALPIVEVSLASPSEPLPAVSTQVGGLDHDREATEAEGMAKVNRGFNEALRKASSRVDELAERVARIFEGSLAALSGAGAATALSFAVSGDPLPAALPQPAAVTVEVTEASEPDMSVVGPLIGALASGHAEEEGSLFESAVKGFDDLTDTVLAEVLAQVQLLAGGVAAPGGSASFAQAGFLADRLAPEQANVRVVTPEVPYPTVGSLAQDMGVRWSISSGLVRARLLELDLSLLKRENELIRTALGELSERLVAKMASTAHGP